MFLGMQIKTALRPLQLLQVRNLSSQFKSKREKSFFRQESLSNEPVVDQFVKYIMKDGLKARAQRIINTSLEFIALKTKENPRAVLEKAVDQISPYVKVASQKRGARNVLLPKPLTPRQRKRIGIQWISEQASSRKGNVDFGTRIGQEIISIINNESQLLAKKENVHKQAVANRSNLVLQDRRLTRSF